MGIRLSHQSFRNHRALPLRAGNPVFPVLASVMNSSDRRIRHEEGDRSAAQSIGAGYPGAVQSHNHEAPGRYLSSVALLPSSINHVSLDNSRPEFTLLVAGCRGGQFKSLFFSYVYSIPFNRCTRDRQNFIPPSPAGY